MSQQQTAELQQFTVSYKLPSTEDHSIDAVTLGNSIIAMDSLIKQADKILNGEASEVSLAVKASREGSFMVEFVAAMSSGGIDVLRTLGLVGLGGAALSGTVMGALQEIRNRKIRSSVIITNDGGTTNHQVELDDGTIIDCPEPVKRLLMSHSVRQQLDAALRKPAGSEEGGSIVLMDGSSEPIELSSEDIENFKVPRVSQFSENQVIEQTVNVKFVQINLEGSSGWRAKITDEDFSVKMSDETFLDRINARSDVVVKDQMFEVLMETTTKKVDDKSTVSRKILRVIRHRVAENRLV